MTRAYPLIVWLNGNRYPLLLVLLTTSMLVVIELTHPFYFLRDDNLHHNLPYYVYNVRALLSGEVPLFNFHQYLGTPALANVQSAAFYLPNYVAVLLSRLFFGHYYGTMEFLAVFHLVFAALGFFKLMRDFDLEEWSCVFGAIAWTFCGFVMTVSDSWIQVAEYAAYLPWLLLLSLRQMRKFDLRGFAALVFLRVMALFVGSPPYVIYTFTFEILTGTVLFFVIKNDGALDVVKTPGMRWNFRAFAAFQARQACGYLCAGLIAAPLLLPAMHQVAISAIRNSALQWEEYSRLSYDATAWFHGLVLPFSDLNYSLWPEQQGISHIGWLTLCFCILAIWRKSINRRLVIVFLLLAVFSLLWAQGSFITKFFYHIPLYNRQRWPFKVAFFTSFFLIALSSVGFDAWYRRMKGPECRCGKFGAVILPLVIMVHVGNFLVLYAVNPERDLSCNKIQRPPFKEPAADVLKNGRIVSLIHTVPEDDPSKVTCAPDEPRLLGFNYATLFERDHFAGYEVLVSDANLKASLLLASNSYFSISSPFDPSAQDLDYFRKWGVKWYVVGKEEEAHTPDMVHTPNILKTAYRDDDYIVLYDEKAKPMVYWLDDANKGGISHRFTVNSIRIVTQRDHSGQIVVNVLHNPFFQVSLDGKQGEILQTRDNQMMVTVPPGRHEVTLVYVDPHFYQGVNISGGFLALLSGGWVLRRLKRERSHARCQR